MSIQVRYRMNALDIGKGKVDKPGELEEGIWGPHNDEPVLDYRDSGTVWIWISDDLCVEVTSELAAEIVKGFKKQEEWEEENKI